MGATRYHVPRERGVTLIELLVVGAILAVVSAITIPLYQGFVDDARMGEASADIKLLETRIERFYSEYRRYPDSLAEMGYGSRRDPWGRHYEYLNIEDGGASVVGQTRKDKNLVPINSDFDLYSRGPDGDTKPPLTAAPSRDDLVRAANGAWLGVAERY